MSLGRSAAKLVVVVALVVLAAFVFASVKGFFGLSNPFRTETTDRTGPPVLKTLAPLSEFRAATAYYEVVVNVEEDTRFVPDFISGESVVYVGKGSVDAFVDFSSLDEDRFQISKDRTAVEIALPAPRLDTPKLDVEGSGPAFTDEGLLQQFQDSDLEREAQIKAVDRIASNANGEDGLVNLAKESTVKTLETMLGSLGFTDVDVTFDEDPR